jgi:hypothetical protein
MKMSGGSAQVGDCGRLGQPGGPEPGQLAPPFGASEKIHNLLASGCVRMFIAWERALLPSHHAEYDGNWL